MDHLDSGALAACYGIPTDMFFVEPGDNGGAADARRICTRCPIIDTCRQWAVDHHEVGIWGGTTDDERDQLRTGRKVRHLAAVRAEALDLLGAGVRPAAVATRLGITVRSVHRYNAAAKAA